MTTSETVGRAVCAVCQLPKNSLRKRKSKLLPNSKPMLVCETCYAGKKEPRWVIILMARKEGSAYVADVVKNKRYVGEPVLLEDLL